MILQALLASLWIVSASPQALASEAAPSPKTQVFTVDGKKVEFEERLDKKVLISKSCRHLKCDAYRKLKSATLKGLNDELRGGANPGAVACAHIGGTIVMGFTENQDENSFCRFKDGSMVSNGSLHYHAMENDDHQDSKKD